MITQIFIFVFAVSEETQKKKRFEKNDKNQLLQNGTDMNFEVSMSARGTIGDNQARKLLPSLETRRTKKLAATGKNWLELFDTSVVGKCCFDGRNENGHRPHMREFQGKSF